MKIYLLRHAESDANSKNIISGGKDTPLSKKGKIQAENLGKYFKNKNILYIYTSNLKRSIKTAEIISKNMKKKPKIIKIEQLNERNFGFFEGKRWDVISAFYKDKLVKKEDKFMKTIIDSPRGESWEDLGKRTINAFNQIIEKSDKRKSIIIIGHLDVNRSLLRYAGNMNDMQMYEIWQTPACINLIKYIQDSFKIEIINYIISSNR